MSDQTECGAPPNADTHLPPCELPAGHEGYHRAVGYAWGTHPTLGPLLPMPEAWAPDAPPPAAGTGTPDEGGMGSSLPREEGSAVKWRARALKAEAERNEARKEAERQKRHNALVTGTLRQERERRKSVQAAALAAEAERDEARALHAEAARDYMRLREASTVDEQTAASLIKQRDESHAKAATAEAEVRRLRDGARGLAEDMEGRAEAAAADALRAGCNGSYNAGEQDAYEWTARRVRALLGEDGETR